MHGAGRVKLSQQSLKSMMKVYFRLMIFRPSSKNTNIIDISSNFANIKGLHKNF